MQASSSSTPNLQPIFEKALKDYKKKTGTDLTTHPIAVELNGCDSPESILAVLEREANELNQSRSSDDRLIKWLGPTVNILNALSATLGEGGGSAFRHTKIIFSGIGILIVAGKSTVTSRDVLVELFDRIESLFRQLKTYTEVPPTQAVIDVLAKIMAEVLSILAVATKGVKERRTKTILKKLAGKGDIEDALQRFRKLEGELLMVIAQVSRETKGDTKQTNVAAEETVKSMDARNPSPSLDVVASTCQSSQIVIGEEGLSPGEPPTPAPEPSHPGAGPGFKHTRKNSVGGPAGPVIETLMWPPPDLAQAPVSGVTWQVQPGLEYTPPPGGPTTHLAPEVSLQPRGLFGPRSPCSSIEALSLEEPPAPVREPPGVATWQSVRFGPTPEKPEAHPAWETWQVQAGLEYTSPEGPPRLFKPPSPRSSIELLTPFRPSTRRPAHQRRVFRRARKKSEVNSPAEHFYAQAAILECPSLPVVAQGGFVDSAAWETWQVQPGLEYTPPPSGPSLLAPELPRQPRGLFGPRSPRSSIEGPLAPVHRQRVFRRTRKTPEAHPPGGAVETPMHTSPAQPPGRVRRRAIPSD